MPYSTLCLRSLHMQNWNGIGSVKQLRGVGGSGRSSERPCEQRLSFEFYVLSRDVFF